MSVLEPAAREFARAAAQGPPLHRLGAVAARGVLEDLEAGPTARPDVDALRETRAATTAVAQAIDVLRRALHPSPQQDVLAGAER